MTDNEILSLYLARDEAAISATSAKYGGYVSSIAYAILESREDSEECVNDTYLAAWSSIPPKNPTNLAAYLGKLARNFALNRRKRRLAEKRGSGQVDLALSELEECLGGSRDVDSRELTEALNSFLASLPETSRRIFVRRYWYLEPIRDLAARFHMSESRVTSLLRRLRGRLGEHLEKEEIYL